QATMARDAAAFRPSSELILVDRMGAKQLYRWTLQVEGRQVEYTFVAKKGLLGGVETRPGDMLIDGRPLATLAFGERFGQALSTAIQNAAAGLSPAQRVFADGPLNDVSKTVQRFEATRLKRGAALAKMPVDVPVAQQLAHELAGSSKLQDRQAAELLHK